MIVKLEPGEVQAAYVLGATRQTVNAAARVRDKCHTPHPMRVHVLGAIAELAWAKLHNHYPDFTTDPRRGTADFVTRGRRVDIKAVDDPRRRLVAHIDKRPGEADVYVLALVVVDSEVDFVGYALDAEFINEARVADLGWGPCYVMPSNELHRFPRDQEQSA